MADVKISALPAVVTAATTDIFAIVQGGVTYKATLTQVVTAITSTGLTATAGALTVNLSTGVAGGQSVVGGTAASNSLTLSSTSNATKGKILFGTSAYDEVNNRLGIGTASPTYAVDITANVNTGFSGLSLTNQNAGNAALSTLLINNDVGNFTIQTFSSTFTPSGTSQTNSARFRTSALLTGGFYFGTGASGTPAPIVLFTNEIERMRIFGGGNVFIGASPSDAGFRLDVNGTARVQERLTVSQDNTVATEVVSVITTDTANCGMVIAPTGVGALIAAIPDGTATGGNARGDYAVDLQMIRSAANQVAAGNNSVIIGGEGNRTANNYSIAAGQLAVASANWSIAFGGQSNSATQTGSVVFGGFSNTSSSTQSTVIGGQSNTASGTSSLVAGDANTASASYSTVAGGYQARAVLYGQRAYASGRFAASSDAQTSAITYRSAITGTAQTELFLDGASVQAILNIASPGPTNARAWRAQIDLVAIVQTVGNGTVVLGECFMGSYHVGIKRIGTATSLVGTVSVTNEVSDTNMATAVTTITADDTSEALKIEFTPPTAAGSTTVIRVVATAYLTEVGY